MEAQLDSVLSEPASLADSIAIPSNIKEPVRNGGYFNVYAYVNGEAKYIPVSSECDVVDYSTGMVAEAYDNRLCAFVIDENSGYYYLRSLGDSYDDRGVFNGIENESDTNLNSTRENEMFLVENARHIANVQRADGEDNNDYLYLGSRDFVRNAYLRDDTKVIVRTYMSDSDTYEWVTYDKDALLFMGLSNSGHVNLGHNIPTETISYVLSNKTNSTQDEYVLVAYITNTYIDDCKDDMESFKKPTVLDQILDRRPDNTTLRNVNASYLSDGNIKLTTTKGDSSIGLDALNINADLYKKIRIRMKADYTAVESEPTSQLFFKRNGATGFTEVMSYKFPFESYASVDGEGWLILDIDLSGFSSWQGTVSEIRFDPTDLMATYTIDYIRFIKNGKYESMSDAQLEAMYTPTRLLADEHFENGFHVRPIINNYTPEGYFEYTGSGDETNNVWAICPWWTHNTDGLSPSNYCDASLVHHRAETDEYTIADKAGTKAITYNPTEKSLSMTLNASKIYNGTAHIRDDASTPDVNESNRTWWPHLLIEQDSKIYTVDKTVNTAAADRMVFEMDVRLTEYVPSTNPEGTNKCQYLVYFYLFSDKYPGQRVWFGLGLFDDGAGILYEPTWNRDSAANQMIYAVPQEVIYRGDENSFLDLERVDGELIVTPIVSDDWKTLRVDLTPHIDRVMEWANRDNVFGGEVKKEDFYFGGVNIGFETHGNIDCTFEIKNCNLVSYS